MYNIREWWLRYVESLEQSENDFDEAAFEIKIRTLKEIIEEFAGNNPKLSELLLQVLNEIEKDKGRFLGQDISVILNQMRYSAIDAEDVKYEVFHFIDGELANENKLKDCADYAAYKEEQEDALFKIKFRKLMIHEFKTALMPEIFPLIQWK